MLKWSVVLAAAVLQMVSGQGPPGPPPPPQCRQPPPGVDKPQDCCKIPEFFKEDDLAECGFVKPDGDSGPPQGPRGPPDCTKELCVLKKYDLTADGDTVDKDAVLAFMDSYIEKNPEFGPAVEAAKERCVGQEIPGPPQICEPHRLVFCVTHTLFTECPKWEETESCTILKKHMEECKPFFPH